MSDDTTRRWVHDCPVCGATLTGEQGERCAEHAITTDEPAPAISPDELARKQRVVDAIGVFLSKPEKPTTFRRWRRPGFR